MWAPLYQGASILVYHQFRYIGIIGFETIGYSTGCHLKGVGAVAVMGLVYQVQRYEENAPPLGLTGMLNFVVPQVQGQVLCNNENTAQGYGCKTATSQ